MKIAIYSPSAINEKGGVESFIKKILPRIAKKHKIDLIVGAGGKIDPLLKKLKNLRIYTYPNIRREQIKLEGDREEDDVLKYSIESSSFFYNSFQHFLIHKYDVVHIHFFGDLIIKNVIKETPLICHFHGIIDTRFDSLIKNTPAEVYLACSKYVAEQNKRVAKNIKVVFDGVDSGFFYPRKVKKKNKFTIFTVGRLEKAKKIDMLLKAFKIVEKKDKDVEFIIGGIGSQLGNLKLLAKKLGLKNVKFTGLIPQNKLPIYYSYADIFVNPRPLEDFGMTVIEAFACGTPVIASNKAGPNETINDECGFRMDVTNPKKIADTILKAKNLDLGKMGRYGRKRVEKFFTWDKIAEQLIGIYKELK